MLEDGEYGVVPVSYTHLDVYKRQVLTSAYEFTGYDDKTLDLLLVYLKNYLKDIPSKSTTVEKIMNILNQNFFPAELEQQDNEFEIDEEWVQDILMKLAKTSFNSVEDIKNIITEGDKHELSGYNQWFKYIINNEPRHATFCDKIKFKQLWVLVKYMSNTWIKEIYKKGKHYRLSLIHI